MLLVTNALPCLLCTGKGVICTPEKRIIIYVVILSANLLLGCCTSLQITALGCFLKRLSGDKETAASYGGIYTSIYKASLLVGLFFTTVLLKFIDEEQYWIFNVAMMGFVIFANMLAWSLNIPNPNNGKPYDTKLEPFGPALKSSIKGLFFTLGSKTMWPCFLPFLLYGANATYHQGVLAIYLKQIMNDSGYSIQDANMTYSLIIVASSIFQYTGGLMAGKIVKR